MPEASLDLLAVYLRRRPLEPVALLRTIRRPVELRDERGLLLAEVVDDLVRAEGARCATREFREIEVERSLDSKRSEYLVRAVVDRFLEAGGIEEHPMLKLTRALGAPALAPAEVVLWPDGPTGGIDVLIGRTFSGSVLQLLHDDPLVRLGGDQEFVTLLRLRSMLRSYPEILEGVTRSSLRQELAWVGNVVGAVRDSDVLAIRLRTNAERCAPEDRSGVAMLLAHLDDLAADARRSMLESLKSERYIDLIDQLILATKGSMTLRTINDESVRRSKDDADLSAVRHAWSRLAEAVDLLESAPSDAVLHRVRILAKRCRLCAEVVAQNVGPHAREFVIAITGIQDLLGEYHDSVIAESWLRASLLPDSRIAAGELIFLERLARESCWAAWPSQWSRASRKRLRDWF